MRWILLLCLSLSLPALADLDYALKPRLIADDTWLLEAVPTILPRTTAAISSIPRSSSPRPVWW